MTHKQRAELTKKRADEAVRIVGVTRDENDHPALRKIARACIALARQQLDQERQPAKSNEQMSSREAEHA
ncbi:hypothetical protein [Antrihabitans stalactiti]|uniref:Uncharacterized protein n=1 Tax=Antrihabitans stalactiti TaxID=2584121 RepID=A0A848KIA4_9NOCA|nr:hypothetical protein [Antrihabitans stalactiti]NMN98455.1 hypothetical protein [Antrihabitans stalactiti]